MFSIAWWLTKKIYSRSHKNVILTLLPISFSGFEQLFLPLWTGIEREGKQKMKIIQFVFFLII